jgi:hypothetical protein
MASSYRTGHRPSAIGRDFDFDFDFDFDKGFGRVANSE